MTMKIKLDEGAIMPTRAHEHDAGLDLYAMEDRKVLTHSWELVSTGVHIQLPPGTVGLLRGRSSMTASGIISGEGTIDEGFTGGIKAALYNHSYFDFPVRRGDRIAELVIVPCIKPTLELVDTLEDTPRGDGGFGSTGK